jgi:hypothetical protein
MRIEERPDIIEQIEPCLIRPTFREIKPFGEHVEGLSRCKHGTCVIRSVVQWGALSPQGTGPFRPTADGI